MFTVEDPDLAALATAIEYDRENPTLIRIMGIGRIDRFHRIAIVSQFCLRQGACLVVKAANGIK